MSPFRAEPGEVDAPLPPKSTLTLGYGDGGIDRGSPWKYTIPEGWKKSLVFYKLFLYASPTDLSSIRQELPFFIGSSDARRPAVLPSKAWATKLLTVKLIQEEGIHWHAVNMIPLSWPEWWIGWIFLFHSLDDHCYFSEALVLIFPLDTDFIKPFFDEAFFLVFGQGLRFLETGLVYRELARD